MIFIATSVVLEVILLCVTYLFHTVLVRKVPLGMVYDIEVKLLPPSIRVKISKEDRS